MLKKLMAKLELGKTKTHDNIYAEKKSKQKKSKEERK
jgi:hypothetical protein